MEIYLNYYKYYHKKDKAKNGYILINYNAESTDDISR